MLKRLVSSTSSPLVLGALGTGVVGVGLIGGALALRKRKKGRSAALGGGSTLRPAEGYLAGDATTLGADWTGFADALGREGVWSVDVGRIPAMVGGNGSGGSGPRDASSVFEEGLRAVAEGLDRGSSSFRPVETRQPDVGPSRSGRWRPARVAPLDAVGTPALPAVEPWPVGAEVPAVPALEVVRDAEGRPRRSNYRLKRARQWMVDRAKEDERWARFMGGRSERRAVVSPSTLAMSEVDRFDELAQLGQIEMEIFTDGRPSGEHGTVGVGRGRRFVMWFRLRILGEESRSRKEK